jgi:hypothetical protein
VTILEVLAGCSKNYQSSSSQELVKRVERVLQYLEAVAAAKDEHLPSNSCRGCALHVGNLLDEEVPREGP